MQCPKCQIENSEDAKICSSCGTSLTSNTQITTEPIKIKTSQMAIVALVLAILSFFFAIFTGLPALILGFIALLNIEKSGGKLTGRNFAIAGIIMPLISSVIFLIFFMAGFSKIKHYAYRKACEKNLADIGKAMLSYASDYDGMFPHAGAPGARWVSHIVYNAANRYVAYNIGGTGTGGHATISASFYLLVKYAGLTTNAFICKGDSGVTAFKLGNNIDLTMLWDFGDKPRDHCSYSYHQPYSASSSLAYPLTTSSEPGMAVAADPNPWLDKNAEGTRNFASFIPEGGKEATKQGNAVTHQDEGQNVLFLDSHVDFESVSYCAINEDNIFTQARVGQDVRKGIQPINGGQIPLSRIDNLLSMDYGISSLGTKGMGCFPADTLVWIDGHTTLISNVTVSTEVQKLEEHNGSWECRDIFLDSGNTIRVVENHLFMNESGLWINARDLRRGMTLKTRNGSVTIKKVITREAPYIGKVYNIKTITKQYMVGEDAVIVRDY